MVTIGSKFPLLILPMHRTRRMACVGSNLSNTMPHRGAPTHSAAAAAAQQQLPALSWEPPLEVLRGGQSVMVPVVGRVPSPGATPTGGSGPGLLCWCTKQGRQSPQAAPVPATAR